MHLLVSQCRRRRRFLIGLVAAGRTETGRPRRAVLGPALYLVPRGWRDTGACVQRWYRLQ